MRNIIKYWIIAVLIVLANINETHAAAPNWTVAPSNFIYSMTMTAKIAPDGFLSEDVNDKLAAFVGNECRGYVSVRYISSTNQYYAFLMVYGNTDGEALTFKMYDASTDLIVEAEEKINFQINGIIGSLSNPYSFTNKSLNNEAVLKSLSFQQQVGNTVFNDKQLTVDLIYGTALNQLVPVFTISTGARLKLGTTLLESNRSIVDLSNPVTLSVISENGIVTTDYQLTVRWANASPTKINLTGNSIEENNRDGVLIGQFNTESPDNDAHYYRLIDGFPEFRNDLFWIGGGNQLYSSSAYNYEQAASYKIYVESSDLKGGIIYQAFTIAIIDVNEAPTAITISNVYAPFNCAEGTEVATLNVVDQDITDIHTFTLSLGNGTNDVHNSWFKIVGDKIIAAQDLVFPPGTLYYLHVSCSDQGGESISAAIQLSGTNAGNPPHDILLSNKIVAEGNTAPVKVGTLSALDVDKDDTAEFSLADDPEGLSNNSDFSIEGSSLMIHDNLLLLKKRIYKVIVKAEDKAGNTFEKNLEITVGRNPNVTYFTLPNNGLYENSPSGTLIANVQSALIDVTTLQFDLPDIATGFDNKSLSISGNGLFIANPFDYEQQQNIAVRIHAQNSNGEVSQDFNIPVKNVNEPIVSVQLTGNNIAENNQLGMVIGDFMASDPDINDVHTFSFENGDGDIHNAYFSILNHQLILNRKVDFELNPQLQIRVLASDLGNYKLSKKFIINIDNLNEAPWAVSFAPNPIRAEIQAGEIAGQLKVLDEDANDVHSILLIAGDGINDSDNNLFTVDNSKLVFANPYQIRPESQFHILVQGKDAGGLTINQALVIQGSDMIGHVPTNIILSDNLIDEGNDLPITVGTLTAVDDDENDGSFFLLSDDLLNETDNKDFIINGNTLTIVNEVHYLIKSQYLVEIEAIDNAGNRFTKRFTIYVKQDSGIDYFILNNNTILENSVVGTLIGEFITEIPEMDACSLTLPNDVNPNEFSNGAFSLSGRQLFSSVQFNFEEKSTHKIRIKIENNGIIIFQEFSITVNDVNDAPKDLFLSNISINENANQGTVVAKLESVDEDKNDQHLFQFISGVGDGQNTWFTISGNDLLLNHEVNYEEQATLNIRLKVTDESGLELTKAFELNVLDVNEAPSELQFVVKRANAQNGIGIQVGTLIVIDVDANDEHSFEFVSGNGLNGVHNQLFQIIDNTILTSSALNIAPIDQFSIALKCSDAKGESISKSFLFNGIDLVGHAPSDIHLSANEIEEGILPPYNIGIFTSDDLDEGDEATYSLTTNISGNTDNSLFTIEGNKLQLQTTAFALNRSAYNIEVQVSDKAGNTFTKPFELKVNPADAANYFSLSNLSVKENKAAGTIVGFMNCEIVPVNKLIFSLPLDVDLSIYSNDKFTFKDNVLLTASVFDFEQDTDKKVLVKITNNGVSLFYETTISIENDNDKPEGIISSNDKISESALIGDVVTSLTAIDQDLNETFIYNLKIGNGSNDSGNQYFKVVDNTLVLNRLVDYETTKNLNVLIGVSDKNNEEYIQALRFIITDANDAPVITSKPANHVLQADVFVYAVEAIDNEGDAITVTINNLPIWLSFNSSLNMIVGTPGNDEVGVHIFSIVVSDGKKSSTQNVILNVIDINDAPQINYFVDNQQFYIGIENEINLPADCFYDIDKGDVLNYRLAKENNSSLPDWLKFDKSRFVISGTPQKENAGTYNLKLTASDKSNLSAWQVFELKVESFTGSADLSEIGFELYPNPATRYVSIKHSGLFKTGSIIILNMDGKEMLTNELSHSNLQEVDLKNIPPGNYIVVITLEQRKYTKKLIVK